MDVVSLGHSPSQNPDIPNAQHSTTCRSQTPSQTQFPVPEQHGLFDLGALELSGSQVSEHDLFQALRPKPLSGAQSPPPAVPEQCCLFSPDITTPDQGLTSSTSVPTLPDELVHPQLSHPSPSNPLQFSLPWESLPTTYGHVFTTLAPYTQNIALPVTEALPASAGYSDDRCCTTPVLQIWVGRG